MKILLDEDVAAPFVEMIRYLLKTHEIRSVRELGWSGKQDIPLYQDAARRGYEVMVSGNHHQLDDPGETAAIRRSSMHVIYYEQESGLKGLGLTAGGLLASIVPAVGDLERAAGQRLVRIPLMSGRKRHEVTDPVRNPPRYWA